MSVNVELVKIRTILELTGGKSLRLPANILSTVFSSIFFGSHSKTGLHKAKGTFINKGASIDQTDRKKDFVACHLATIHDIPRRRRKGLYLLTFLPTSEKSTVMSKIAFHY